MSNTGCAGGGLLALTVRTRYRKTGVRHLAVSGRYVAILESAQKIMTIRRKELVDHYGEHGC